MLRVFLGGVAIVTASCSLLFPLDFTGGALDGGAGGVAGGSSGGVAGGGSTSGGAAGGAAGGSTSGGASGGSTSGGSAGGSTGGGVAGGSAGGTTVPDAGPCTPIAGTTVVVCYDFESTTLPGPLERVSSNAPSSLLTAEVVFDGGRPGGVLRMTMPAAPAQNGTAHGGFFRTSLGTARRFRLDFDLRPVTHRAPDQVHSAAFEGPSTWATLAGDPGGHFLYVPQGTALETSRGTSPRWQHFVWLMDFTSQTAIVTLDGTTLLDGGVAAGQGSPLDFKFGWPAQYNFDSAAELLFDNVVLRSLP